VVQRQCCGSIVIGTNHWHNAGFCVTLPLAALKLSFFECGIHNSVDAVSISGYIKDRTIDEPLGGFSDPLAMKLSCL
jgi:hypothetical protein